VSRRGGGTDVATQTTISGLTLSQAMARFDQLQASEAATVGVRDSYAASVWVYGAVSQIAGTISNAPFCVYGRSGTPVDGGPLFQLVNRPNDYDQQGTSAKFRYAYFTEMLLNGAAMRVLTGMRGFAPSGMLVRPRWQFTAQDSVDEDGVLRVLRWLRYSRGSAKTYIPGDDVYHDALFNPYHDYEGLAPLEAALVGINNDADSGQFAHRYFANDSSTGVVFTSEHAAFTQAAADQAQRRWQELHAGVNRAFGAKFVGFGLKPHQVGSAFDAEAHRILKGLTKEEVVTGIFKIPLEVFGAEKASEGIVIGDRQADTAQEAFLVNVVMPWSKRYDEEFNSDVAWRFGAEFRGAHDFNGHPLLEKRRLERARAAAELIDRGIPINLVIKWLGLQVATVPWGDEWWVPNNMIPASVIQAAGERALFDRATSPSAAGEKPEKPGVRDRGGHKAVDKRQGFNDPRLESLSAESLRDYVADILELSKTARVRNGVGRNGTGGTGAGRLADVLREVGA